MRGVVCPVESEQRDSSNPHLRALKPLSCRTTWLPSSPDLARNELLDEELKAVYHSHANAGRLYGGNGNRSSGSGCDSGFK